MNVRNFQPRKIFPGDRLVGTTSNSQTWATPQDVALTINYPRSGVGAIVSFIEVVVTQVQRKSYHSPESPLNRDFFIS